MEVVVKQMSQYKEVWHQCVRTFSYSSNNIVTEAFVRAWFCNYAFERQEHFYMQENK